MITQYNDPRRIFFLIHGIQTNRKTCGHLNVRIGSHSRRIISRLSRPWPEPNHQYFYCWLTLVKRKRGARGRSRNPPAVPFSLLLSLYLLFFSFFARVTASKGGQRQAKWYPSYVMEGAASRNAVRGSRLRRIDPVGEKKRHAFSKR